ncbi:DNA-binding transcriptional LysR family regulator [Bosea psychrotolerans]|uniref:DNA-binding transcriptional LysR family regulator n=1 Tax=Bosea psychrotolerans TaxID=1871628 RepID=A0A2S4MEF5_9HYPH|nr:DNA-binding transcriptional LysR family regulator [Bosea psychrotolerans]
MGSPSLTRGSSCVAIPFRGGGTAVRGGVQARPKGEFVTAKRPKLHHLNWNLLHTFLVIVEERSITRAADRLLVRQPSVSAALQRLEETLGGQLVQRDSRRFVLTKRGELLHKECVDIYRSVARIGEKLSEEHDELTGLVRVQLITHMVLPAFDRALSLMSRRHPGVTVRVEVASSQDIVRSVSQRLSPFGFCLLPNPLAGLNCRHLLREEFGILCGRDHALHGRAGVPLHELADEPFIALACGQDGALEPMVSLREGAGLGSRTVGASPNLEEVARMIAAGMGIGILPLASVQDAIDTGTLWNLSGAGGELGADLYFVSSPAMGLSAAELAFQRLFEDMLEAESAPPEIIDNPLIAGLALPLA